MELSLHSVSYIHNRSFFGCETPPPFPHPLPLQSKIEKGGIFEVKSGKITASFRKLVPTIGAYANSKKGWNQVPGRVSIPCWHATPMDILLCTCQSVQQLMKAITWECLKPYRLQPWYTDSHQLVDDPYCSAGLWIKVIFMPPPLPPSFQHTFRRRRCFASEASNW